MGNANRIIEFYGLPGAGKTTVCNELINSTNFRATNVNELMIRYHKESLVRKIMAIPVNAWFLSAKFLFELHKCTKFSRDDIKTLFYLQLVFSYFKKQQFFNLLLIDHGLIQQLGSLLHENQFEITDTLLEKYINILPNYQGWSAVFCSLPVAISLKRIENRNRDNGRIDLIIHNSELAQKLIQKELFLFQRVFEKIGCRCYRVDFSLEQDAVFKNVTDLL